jgi:hypothetical protein
MGIERHGWLLVALTACGGSTSNTPQQCANDAGSTVPEAGRDAAAEGPVDSGGDVESPSDGGDAGAPGDAGDAGVTPSSCRELHAAQPLLPDGVYTIDVDGPGPIPPLGLYCDMSFNQGGWTMIQSYTGQSSPQDLLGADGGGVDGGTGFLVGPPSPGAFGALTGTVVEAIAGISTQVHIRMSFQSDAGANEATWITSRAPTSSSDVPLPIAALRTLHVVTKGSSGGFADFFGPSATAAELSWTPSYTAVSVSCEGLVDQAVYPNIIWPCGNDTGVTIITLQPNAGGAGGHATATWRWAGPTEQPVEVYVR